VYSLHVNNRTQASYIVRAQRNGRPFTGCTQLYMQAADLPACSAAHHVLSKAQQWPALQQLQLSLPTITKQQQPTLLPGVLRSVSALQHLRSLELFLPYFDSSAAGHVGQMTHLTALTLAVTEAAAHVPEDLCALSRLRQLKHLSLEPAPAVQPAAAPGGPYCLPGSLTSLNFDQLAAFELDEDGDAAHMAYWLTHLPACRQLEQLRVLWKGEQHPSAHPAAVARLLAQHCPRLCALTMTALLADWDTSVAGLPDAVAPSSWLAEGGLAALSGLESLEAVDMSISTEAQLQQLAQLSCLTCLGEATFECVLSQPISTFLRVL
jgi:hypothetical protein